MNARNHKEYTVPGFDSMQATLATQRQPTPLLLAPVGDTTVELDFDGGRLSSDAGLILIVYGSFRGIENMRNIP
jgi:hypothetical protein